MMDRARALEMLRTYLRDDKMVKHCIAVEAIMRALARRLGRDEEKWGIVGLLHDIDYDVTGRDLRVHGLKAMEILKGELPEELLRVIACHNENTGIEPETEEGKEMCIALRAADQMSGLIVATALVMPSKKIAEIKLSTLRRKFKSKDFARGVRRDRILGIEKLGIPLDEFMQLSLEAMKGVAEELGL